MNKKMLTITAVAALVGGTASYAATSDDVKSTDKEWVDESAPATSRMSNSVKKFVEAQKSNAQKRKVSLKSDVLGRRGGAQKGSLDYAIKDSDVQKMKVVINDVKTNDIPLPTVSGRYEFNPNTNQKAYWLNGTKVSESEYLSKAEKSTSLNIRKLNQTFLMVLRITEIIRISFRSLVSPVMHITMASRAGASASIITKVAALRLAT